MAAPGPVGAGPGGPGGGNSGNGGPPELHPRTGRLVALAPGGRSAARAQPGQEFNHGLVLSRRPLVPGRVFCVRIDRKVGGGDWGSEGDRGGGRGLWGDGGGIGGTGRGNQEV